MLNKLKLCSAYLVPDSNYFLVGETADVGMLKQHINIIFGTDSALSASWSIWEQLRLATGTQK